MERVKTGSWMGPPQGKWAPRAGPISNVILAERFYRRCGLEDGVCQSKIKRERDRARGRERDRQSVRVWMCVRERSGTSGVAISRPDTYNL